ncbi:alpha/beta fold hydrolase [Paraburkholderia humisilvae]|uniref:Pyrethroid hydrolase n=1 Tax=Paraburkholderia humisilvae TaxID=627669 RepID=A0A6J5EDW9_9BURK|nr:alpha/beta fold hydrolase [Paraburkholderia humisilvae]CAB3763235.1 Pyrethroid hydrolase [Paraburkholderia humisilvae]
MIDQHRSDGRTSADGETTRHDGHSPGAVRLPFVLVHGGWWGAWSFERLIPLLMSWGHVALARDLPGHGLNARFPSSYLRRPMDTASFQTERSPNAQITRDDHVDAIIDAIECVSGFGHGEVVLVGHSMSGALISMVAERVPERIAKIVYLAAFMPRTGMAMADYIDAPENAGQLVPHLFRGDPAATGAARIDHRADDAASREMGRRAFCGDMSEEDYRAVVNLTTPDEAVAPMATPVWITPERWGSVERHYIMCLQDYALRPALQTRFIEEADALFPYQPTVVHCLDASHGVVLSQPAALAELLVKIATAGRSDVV